MALLTPGLILGVMDVKNRSYQEINDKEKSLKTRKATQGDWDAFLAL